jgi:hypothetical protein
VRFTQFLNVATSQRPTDLGIKILEILVLAKKLRAILKMLGGRTIDFKFIQFWYLQPIITQYFASNKSEIWP